MDTLDGEEEKRALSRTVTRRIGTRRQLESVSCLFVMRGAVTGQQAGLGPDFRLRRKAEPRIWPVTNERGSTGLDTPRDLAQSQ